MSAIGREGGHSRGRTRQPMPGESNTIATDTERSSYIGQGSDRGSFGEPERNMTQSRSDSGNDFRSDNNLGRGSF
jgi:hypothetical protein